MFYNSIRQHIVVPTVFDVLQPVNYCRLIIFRQLNNLAFLKWHFYFISIFTQTRSRTFVNFQQRPPISVLYCLLQCPIENEIFLLLFFTIYKDPNFQIVPEENIMMNGGCKVLLILQTYRNYRLFTRGYLIVF